MPNTGKQDWTPPKLSSFETPEQVWAYYSPRAKPDELPKLRRFVDRMREVKSRRDDDQITRRRQA